MNWTRDLLKHNAKSVLKKSFFNAAGVCACYFTVNLIYSLLAWAGASFVNIDFLLANDQFEVSELVDEISRIFGRAYMLPFDINTLSSRNLWLIGSVVSIISIAIIVFILNPLEIGTYSFFIKNRENNEPVSTMFDSFCDGCYLRNVGAQLLRSIYTFLWSLVFVIPGIVKSYEYSMVPYLLAQNKGMSVSRAFDLSKFMTAGEKGRMFILDLSFIGWLMLLSFVSGIIAIPMIYYILYALLFMPYYFSVKTELYTALKEKVISCGFAGMNDFVL